MFCQHSQYNLTAETKHRIIFLFINDLSSYKMIHSKFCSVSVTHYFIILADSIIFILLKFVTDVIYCRHFQNLFSRFDYPDNYIVNYIYIYF